MVFGKIKKKLTKMASEKNQLENQLKKSMKLNLKFKRENEPFRPDCPPTCGIGGSKGAGTPCHKNDVVFNRQPGNHLAVWWGAGQ